MQPTVMIYKFKIQRQSWTYIESKERDQQFS